MKNNTFHILLALVILFGFVFSGCENNNGQGTIDKEQTNYFSPIYRIKNYPLTSISTDWSINLNMLLILK